MHINIDNHKKTYSSAYPEIINGDCGMRLSDSTLNKLQKALRANMFLGLIITVASTYMVITGTYDNIQQRETQELLLSILALGGLFYTFVFWIACVFRKQFFQQDEPQPNQ